MRPGADITPFERRHTCNSQNPGLEVSSIRHLTTDELSHALTMAGLEVEGLRPVAPPTTKIVVGQVLEVAKHPNADKLNVCQVDAGTGETLNIVCGAPNVSPGIKVPVALVGAQLPPAEAGGEPFAIKLSKLRGVESQGMLCSARELKLSEDHSGLLILPADTPIGQDIRETLNLDDTVFEIKLTPNKADCLSVFGVARETAAITGAPLQGARHAAGCRCARRKAAGEDPGARPVRTFLGSRDPRRERAREDAAMDGRAARAFGPAQHLRARRHLELRDARTRPSDARVRSGQDPRRYRSALGPQGRDAQAAERQYRRTRRNRRRDRRRPARRKSRRASWAATARPSSLDTTNIYLEAAFWWPDSIRGRARKYNFSTDAAHRFERGVDYSTTVEHIERISQLILDICGGEAGPVDDQIVNLPTARAGEDARRACAPHHRHRDRRGRNRADLHAARPRVRARRRHVLRDAAAVSLRHRDRRRSDRGGRAHLRLREDSGAPAGRQERNASDQRDEAFGSYDSPRASPRATTRRP